MIARNNNNNMVENLGTETTQFFFWSAKRLPQSQWNAMKFGIAQLFLILNIYWNFQSILVRLWHSFRFFRKFFNRSKRQDLIEIFIKSLTQMVFFLQRKVQIFKLNHRKYYSNVFLKNSAILRFEKRKIVTFQSFFETKPASVFGHFHR